MRATLLAAVMASVALSAAADPAAIRVDAAWSRALPPVSDNGAAYVTVVNLGSEADALVGAETPVAERAELHEHVRVGGMMKMRKVDSVALAPGQAVVMEPGGLHVMLMALRRPLQEGAHFPLTLRFSNAPDMTVQVDVVAMGAAGNAKMQGHGGGGHMHGGGTATR